jgi:hypothetical protein
MIFKLWRDFIGKAIESKDWLGAWFGLSDVKSWGRWFLRAEANPAAVGQVAFEWKCVDFFRKLLVWFVESLKELFDLIFFICDMQVG